MGVAESAAADWPRVLCVICHLTRPHGWLAVLLDWCDGCGCVRLVGQSTIGRGGAIYVGTNAQVDIRGSVLSNNQAVRGNGGAQARHER